VLYNKHFNQNLKEALNSCPETASELYVQYRNFLTGYSYSLCESPVKLTMIIEAVLEDLKNKTAPVAVVIARQPT
jgi:hypothetical protein